ncbi:MAG: 5'-nucleotidase C-terminal domain-containing protein, partial [Lachnospiraceae bacterium]
VNDLRQNSDVLLLDGGDIYQGNPVSNLLMGAPMTAAMDAMKYDAVALGNHEFDWGVTKLLDNDGTMGSYNLSNSEGSAVGNSKIPVVCANMFDAKTNERVNFTKDYVILDKKVKSLNGVSGTIKVAVFGYVDDYSKDIMAAQIAPYKIDETKLKEIEDQARKMEDAGLVDASVVLAHAGANSIAEEFVTGGPIDLVLGGHTHQSVCGVATNGVAYAQPKNQAQDYAYTEICMDPITKEIYVENNETKTVYSKTTKEVLYNTEKNAAELDAEVVKISKIASKEVAPTMNQKLGTITKQVTKGSISGNKFSSTAGNFMTELQNAATGAKISFTNGGGIRTEFTFDTPVRMLTAGDIYTIAPFCNTLPTFELTYSEVLDLVKYAVGAGESLSLRMGGATAYYSEKGEVTTLFIGDKLVYADGQYQNGHSALEKVIVCTNEYVATAKGTPFASKKSIETLNGKTPATDNEAFIAALKIEAMYNDGNIYVNPNATIVKGAWDGKTIPEDRTSRFLGDAESDDNMPVPPIQVPDKDKEDDKEDDKDKEVNEDGDVVLEKAEIVKTDISTKSVTATEDEKGFFYTADGKKVTNAIVKTEDGDRFILNEKGEKYVSSIVSTKNKTKYITDEDGEIITGDIVKVNGERYYTTKSTGKIVTNKAIKVDGKKYFATKSGALASGKIVGNEKDSYYTSKKTGVIVTNKLIKVDGKKYFATKSGKLAKSKWIMWKGKKYYCNKEGAVIKSK